MSSNLTWVETRITQKDREILNGHRGLVLWFTGLSASGKSALACALEKALHDKGIRTYLLDGDNVRHGLNSDLGFSASDRQENIRRIGEVAALFADAGIVTLVSFISPYRKDREQARSLLPEGSFHEIFVNCPLQVCEQRDPKGLYRKARAGEIPDFTGISAPYEEPLSPELTLNTAENDLQTCLEQLLSYIQPLI